jgi:hypothetical protein
MKLMSPKRLYSFAIYAKIKIEGSERRTIIPEYDNGAGIFPGYGCTQLFDLHTIRVIEGSTGIEAVIMLVPTDKLYECHISSGFSGTGFNSCFVCRPACIEVCLYLKVIDLACLFVKIIARHYQVHRVNFSECGFVLAPLRNSVKGNGKCH